MMNVSVAIITNNEEETLPFVFESLLPIRDIIKEVVVVDDGSVDGTLQVCGQYAGLGLPMQTWRRDFDNFAAQKNFALDKCTGDYVLGLDADHAFNSLRFAELFREGFFRSYVVWDFGLYYCKGDIWHYDASSPDIGMPTTRFWWNCGLRYERPVHEYLVFPGEHGWDSIHNGTKLSCTGEVCILELQMLKSRQSLVNRVARYSKFAEQSGSAGIPVPSLDNIESLCDDRNRSAIDMPQRILSGVPRGVLDLPTPWVERGG